MTLGARAEVVVTGQVLLAVDSHGLHRAEAVGIAAGRVVSAGSRADLLAAAHGGARVIEAGDRAVIPGITDFHLHLVGMARMRRAVALDDARDFAAILANVQEASAALPPRRWLTGRGWSESSLEPASRATLSALAAAVGDRRVVLTSHDGHSAWASPAALAAAGITRSLPDPLGGRIERDADGEPTGVLRESALIPMSAAAERLRGSELRPALLETLEELAGLGITGAIDAGDASVDGGSGMFADLGDSFSTLADLAPQLDGRIRLTLNLPGEGIAAAARLSLQTGTGLPETHALRAGWAKVYADGALGSRTAATYDPYTCGDADQRDSGILRHGPGELDELFGAGRAAGISLAVHAIGDRAAATVIDAAARAVAGAAPQHRIPDRMEHLQLIRDSDRHRLGALGITASVQPIHQAADRDAVDACWAGRESDAYAYRSLAAAGALLAFGSDAPVEAINPWHGYFAAVRRHAPDDGRDAWRHEEALTPPQALAAYTSGPARAMRVDDEGHLRPGAHADLAVLDIDLATLLEADEAAASARSELTLVAGREVSAS